MFKIERIWKMYAHVLRINIQLRYILKVKKAIRIETAQQDVS